MKHARINIVTSGSLTQCANSVTTGSL